MMGTETASISSFENIEGMDPAQLQLGLGPCWPSRAQNGFAKISNVVPPR